MKKIIATLIIILILLVQIKNTYKDGGTTTYTSLTYKIVNWKVIEQPESDDIIIFNNESDDITISNNENETISYFQTTQIYLFPFNFMSMNWYRERLKIK